LSPAAADKLREQRQHVALHASHVLRVDYDHRNKCALRPCSQASSEARLVVRLLKKKRERRETRFKDMKKRKKAKKKQERKKRYDEMKEMKEVTELKEVKAAWDGAAAEQNAASRDKHSGGGSGDDGGGGSNDVVKGLDGIAATKPTTNVTEQRAVALNRTGTVDVGDIRGGETECMSTESVGRQINEGTAESCCNTVADFLSSCDMLIEDVDAGEGDARISTAVVGTSALTAAGSSMATGCHAMIKTDGVAAALALTLDAEADANGPAVDEIVTPATPSLALLPHSSARPVSESLRPPLLVVQPLQAFPTSHVQAYYDALSQQAHTNTPKAASSSGAGPVTESAGYHPDPGQGPSAPSAARLSTSVSSPTSKLLPPWERASNIAAEQLEAKVGPCVSAIETKSLTRNTPIS
jgi:hypothetical protein